MKLLVLLMMPGLLFAQSVRVSRIIEYEPDGTDQMQRFEKLLSPTGVGFFAEPTLKLITIWSDNKERVDEAEQVFKRYYKPKPTGTAAIKDRNVEIMLHILLGKSGSAEPSDAPPALNAVIAQLKQVTTLTSFRNLETQILRVRDGKRVESSGVLNWADVPDSAAPLYNFTANVSAPGASIRLEDLKFGTRVVPSKVGDNQYNFREVGVSSSFDVKPGQQVVVGKTNASGKDGALILVLSARIVE